MTFRHKTLRAYGRVVALALPWVLPALAIAKPTEDETALLEARLDGYTTAVRLAEPGSNGVTWMLLIVLIIIATAVLFKNANRSHLD